MVTEIAPQWYQIANDVENFPKMKKILVKLKLENLNERINLEINSINL